MLGFSVEDWHAEDSSIARKTIHPDDLERVRAEDGRAEEDGTNFHSEYRAVHRDGRTVWIEENCVLLQDGPDVRRQWLGVMFDVTERAEAVRELQRSYELLRRADEQRRDLLSRVIHVQDEERRRIAADIHDDTIQKMTAVGLRVEALRNRIRDPAGLKLLEELGEAVSAAIGRLRHVIFELHPQALESGGLGDAVRDALAELEGQTGIASTLHDSVGEGAGSDTRIVAFRIVQEALSNVRKHAAARSVVVTLAADADGILVRVRDDGAGFARGASESKAGHLGLVSMRERAEMAGGRFKIETSPGAGTMVEAWIADRAPNTERARPAAG